MGTHFNHVILYKKEVDYTAEEFRLQGSESRQSPHLHILSPNIKTSAHTIHQIESFSFLPLQLEKRMGWKMLCSQQVLDCCALTWFAYFLPLPSGRCRLLHQRISAADCQHVLQNVRLLQQHMSGVEGE
jgi:hypothetical protein